MAQSPAHRLGQIIGDILEASVRKPLQELADQYGLYLDYKHKRSARDGKSSVAWQDSYGNTHDLDYVFETGGSEEIRGRPRAFIETAWRRYTKHSRNKAQEIQSAVMPLADTYSDCRPFLGVVLAGVFTRGSLSQLRSHGFSVAYCPYDTVAQAFYEEGFDVKSDENTSEEELLRKVDSLELLTTDERLRIEEAILRLHNDQFEVFFNAMRTCLTRVVEYVFILTLSGDTRRFDTVRDAIDFVNGYDQGASVSGFVRYELNIRYSNGDEIRGAFQDRTEAINFLSTMAN